MTAESLHVSLKVDTAVAFDTPVVAGSCAGLDPYHDTMRSMSSKQPLDISPMRVAAQAMNLIGLGLARSVCCVLAIATRREYLTCFLLTASSHALEGFPTNGVGTPVAAEVRSASHSPMCQFPFNLFCYG